LKYLRTYKILEKKKHNLKRLSEEQYKKQIEKELKIKRWSTVLANKRD